MICQMIEVALKLADMRDSESQGSKQRCKDVQSIGS